MWYSSPRPFGRPLDRVEEDVEAGAHQAVGGIVVVAVAGRAVPQREPQGLAALEVRGQSGEQLLHAQLAVSNTCRRRAENESVRLPIPTPWT